MIKEKLTLFVNQKIESHRLIIVACGFLILVCQPALAQLTVTALPSQNPVVWGKKIKVTSMASGGVSPYSYGFATYCQTPPDPALVPQIHPNVPWYTYEAEYPGANGITCTATDADSPNMLGFANLTIDVTPPNKIELEPGPALIDVENNGVGVSASETVVFNVKAGTVKIGSCVHQGVIAEEKVWTPSTGETEADATWHTGPAFSFSAPRINDLVTFTKSIANWNAIMPNENISVPVYQRVSIRYKNCQGMEQLD